MHLCPALRMPTTPLDTVAQSSFPCEGEYSAGRRELRPKQWRPSSRGGPPKIPISAADENPWEEKSSPRKVSPVRVELVKARVHKNSPKHGLIGKWTPAFAGLCRLNQAFGVRGKTRMEGRTVFPIWGLGIIRKAAFIRGARTGHSEILLATLEQTALSMLQRLTTSSQ